MVAKSQYLTVAALTAYLKRKFDADPYLSKVYLTGELSNLGRRRGRHLYFSIKDPSGQAVISAAMFSYAGRLKFEPEEGMKILAIGRIQLYEPNGSYSIIVEQMTPDGVGELYLAYEQLKKRLQAEGLFNQPKKQLPLFPKRIAVITSPTGAVIEDIVQTAHRRFPSAQVILLPAVVQGQQAVPSLLAQLDRVDDLDFDVAIIGRGGGSIEDLWAFNDEALVRKMAALKTPLISSVGHETDNTLADLVADRRAATPTAAAELATPVTLTQLRDRIHELRVRLVNSMQGEIRTRQRILTKILERPIFQQPDRLYTAYQQQVDQLAERLVGSMQQRLRFTEQRVNTLANRQQLVGQNLLKGPKERLALLSAKLDLVSPLTTVSRGYTIVENEADEIVRSVDQLQVDQAVKLRLADGRAQAKITGVSHESDR
ncbi:exodeoxyribonuclease VII large subunit [Leuconostocaceae bacterium ESL0723]|nr:exodeoxyribonuclease VII large subunit [Leuconostocaceae bacterium ESL0723]